VSQFELAHQGVIGVGDSGKFAAGNGEKLIGAVKGSDLGNDVAGFGERIVVDHETAGDGARDFSAGVRDAAEILGAIIVGNEIDEFAIR